MHIELLDSLRCTRPHEDTWLVAAFDQLDGRDVVEGLLACPLCKTEYPIRESIAYFDVEPEPRPPGAPPSADADRAMTVAALLGLTEPGGIVVLAGAWTVEAPVVAGLAAVRLLLVNPARGAAPAAGDASERERPSILRVRGRLPLGPATVRGIALDATTAAAGFVDSAVQALRSGGRLVAPASILVPDEIAELARDEDVWVGERAAAPSSPVQLGVGRRR